jgi:hypothetical protein
LFACKTEGQTKTKSSSQTPVLSQTSNTATNFQALDHQKKQQQQPPYNHTTITNCLHTTTTSSRKPKKTKKEKQKQKAGETRNFMSLL